jgi:hypothetical protein
LFLLRGPMRRDTSLLGYGTGQQRADAVQNADPALTQKPKQSFIYATALTVCRQNDFIRYGSEFVTWQPLLSTRLP